MNFRSFFILCFLAFITFSGSVFAQHRLDAFGALTFTIAHYGTRPTSNTINTTLNFAEAGNPGGVLGRYTITGDYDGGGGLNLQGVVIVGSERYQLLLNGTNTYSGSTTVESYLGGTGSSANSAHTIANDGAIFGGTGSGNDGTYTAGNLAFDDFTSLRVYGNGATASKVICKDLSFSNFLTFRVDIMDNIGPGVYNIIEYRNGGGPADAATPPIPGSRGGIPASTPICFRWTGSVLQMTIGVPSATLGTINVCSLPFSETIATTGASLIGTVTGLTGTGLAATFNLATKLITISGTPTVGAGTINYSINLMGCSTVNATGTLTIPTYRTLNAAPANSSQTGCIGVAMPPIVWTTNIAAGIPALTTANLPTWMNAAYDATTRALTITGTPPFNITPTNYPYSIPITGCGTTQTATGTVSVTFNPPCSYPLISS